FRYGVRPRRLGTLTPPGLLARWFDPDSGTVQTHLVKLPPLEVASSAEAAATPGPSRASTAEDAWAVVPSSSKRELELWEEVQTVFGVGWWSAAVLGLPVAVMMAILVRAWLQRFRPVWWDRYRRRHAARVARLWFERTDTPQDARLALADWLSTVVER